MEPFIEFEPGRSLVYLLEGSPSVVTIPMDQMTGWVDSDRVGVGARSQTGTQLLVEKDFQCLHRSVEQKPDAYPHPLMS